MTFLPSHRLERYGLRYYIEVQIQLLLRYLHPYHGLLVQIRLSVLPLLQRQQQQQNQCCRMKKFQAPPTIISKIRMPALLLDRYFAINQTAIITSTRTLILPYMMMFYPFVISNIHVIITSMVRGTTSFPKYNHFVCHRIIYVPRKKPYEGWIDCCIYNIWMYRTINYHPWRMLIINSVVS